MKELMELIKHVFDKLYWLAIILTGLIISPFVLGMISAFIRSFA